MGMFDYVHYETKCPNCGEDINEFQSKDRQCWMETLNYWEVDNFYTHCDKCGTWIEYCLKPGFRKEIPITAYEMIYRTKDTQA